MQPFASCKQFSVLHDSLPCDRSHRRIRGFFQVRMRSLRFLILTTVSWPFSPSPYACPKESMPNVVGGFLSQRVCEVSFWTRTPYGSSSRTGEVSTKFMASRSKETWLIKSQHAGRLEADPAQGEAMWVYLVLE